MDHLARASKVAICETGIMQRTLYPITFEELQRYLLLVGYELKHFDRASDEIMFALAPGAKSAGHLRSPVSIMFPDFTHHATGEPCYDKLYVVDLINSLGSTSHQDGDVLLAIRRAMPLKHQVRGCATR